MSLQRSGYVWWCALTVFVSAFLLFQIQPMISKMILPWFGGGPGVWTACMLFFQIVLLLGYGYAHFLFRLSNTTTATVIHCLLLTGAILLLPIEPKAEWKPTGSDQPTLKILMLLAAKVGLPYFLLASTGPLLQAWFARVTSGVSPYRLYALSNVGSLTGLLTYPFIFEPQFTTTGQGWMWSAGFVLFALCCGALAIATSRMKAVIPETQGSNSVTAVSVENPPGMNTYPPFVHRILWLALPALGSIMLLAVTHYVCQDVAVTPFLWVAPLSLYLLSFIICFDSERWYLRRTFAVIASIAIVVISLHMLYHPLERFLGDAKKKLKDVPAISQAIPWLYDMHEKAHDFFSEISVEAAAYLVLLFLVCMVCHGELVLRKPATKYLTSFYLMTSAGGALGGIFVGLVCPQIFRENWELNVGLVACFVVTATVLVECLALSRFGRNWLLTISCWSCIFSAMLLIVMAQFQAVHSGDIATARNFYGVLRVTESGAEDSAGSYRALYNGRILHGLQLLDPSLRRTPSSYYNARSGIGITMRHYATDNPLRLAVVGLGTGTMASFAHQGDYVRFYEINPKVEEIARRYFTYIDDCPGKVEVILGDARLSMEREQPNDFDVIVLDAFSGDAIPVHLLTKESFKIYFNHLKKNGILAVHISNRHLDLTPVVDGLAEHFQYKAVKINVSEEEEVTDAASDWMLVTNNQEFLDDPVVRESLTEYKDVMKQIPLWTDQFSNLLQILD